MQSLTSCFTAWRIIRAGPREVVEGLVAAEHRGPSPELAAALAAWPHPHYWGTLDRSELVLIRPLDQTRRESWPLHLALFAVTVICALGAGAALKGSFHPTPGDGLGGTLLSGVRFFPEFLLQAPAVLFSGWTFALPLLAILLVHELGHYFVAHRYAIDASPPYFLPIPPTLSPVGSLGDPSLGAVFGTPCPTGAGPAWLALRLRPRDHLRADTVRAVTVRPLPATGRSALY